MNKKEIERIIKQGSTRQKIKLYFTDVAYFNTRGIQTAQIKTSGDKTSLKLPDKILTDRERGVIFDSIKGPKDVKYWEELRTYNKAFLLFKPNITNYSKNFDYLTAQLNRFTTVRLLHINYQDVINDILEVVEEEKLRETLVKTALKSLKPLNAMKYQEPGFLPFIEIPETGKTDNIELFINLINEEIIDAKEYLKGIETFLKKHLPLQPYKQFLKEEESKIKDNILQCRDLIENTLEEELKEDDKFKILRWDEVEVLITEEDIQDIKNAGI